MYYRRQPRARPEVRVRSATPGSAFRPPRPTFGRRNTVLQLEPGRLNLDRKRSRIDDGHGFVCPFEVFRYSP